MPAKTFTVAFSAGEASGDQHAAAMFKEMQTLCPALKGVGMGSSQMAAAGIDLTYDSSAIAVIGVIEVIKHYPEIRRALMRMQTLLIKKKPDLLVCVDYKEFNFKLARFAKQHGIKVLFYVSPQVWAWRAGRVKKYGKVIDLMAVIFPFETAYYEAENIPVRYVGHPSVDKVHLHYSKHEALRQFTLSATAPVVGLLPGSRTNEINRLLPVMLAAATLLQQRNRTLQFVLPQANSISDELISNYVRTSTLPIAIIKGTPYEVMQCCDAVMTTSGTTTLELALLTIPMVICYKLAPITYWLGKRLIKIPFIGLPNIIANKAIIKELIQHEATAENLAEEIWQLLTNTDYANTQREELRYVKEQLGNGGASALMAQLAIEMLDTDELSPQSFKNT